ncbi:MAG: thioredoxin [Thermoplasmata archaeon]|nr:thioredoxin [Thermoplasmata archaeon]
MPDEHESEDKELEKLRIKRVQEIMEAQKMNKSGDQDWPDEPITVTDADFGEVVKKYPFVVIDCWAPWCGPCRMVAPVIDELAKDYTGKIVFGKLNTDENMETAMKYSIMSIPTLLIFKNGELIDRPVGAMPKPLLEENITKHLD